jgi:hypothetical protein
LTLERPTSPEDVRDEAAAAGCRFVLVGDFALGRCRPSGDDPPWGAASPYFPVMSFYDDLVDPDLVVVMQFTFFELPPERLFHHRNARPCTHAVTSSVALTRPKETRSRLHVTDRH